MATTTNVIEALKYGYGVNQVLYLFNEESPTFNILSKVKKPLAGRGQFLMPIVVQNAGAFTGISEGGTLPTALQPDTAEASFSLQEYVGLYNVSWKLIQDARSSKFAFEQAVKMLDDGLRRRIMRNLNSDLLDNGKGRLAVLPAADNSEPVTVNALPRVETGMVVDIMDVDDDDTKRGDSLTVSGVDIINRRIELSGSPTSTGAGDYLVIQDTCDVTSNNPALHSNGLLSVINNADPAAVVGDYGGLARDTAGQEFWQGGLLGNSGSNRPLTEDLLLQGMDMARERGGGKFDAFMSNLAIIRRYHELLAGERYFALSKPGVLSGGIGRKEVDPGKMGLTPYEFSGVPWYVDPYFNANVIIGMDTSHFFIGHGENEAPRPISEIFDNIPFFRQTSSATFEVAWYYQMELLSDNPAAGVQYQDIAEA